tara:strand:- start:339 stop:557 length:219 start_codon:yes stop_codon:yes gene_type:complete
MSKDICWKEVSGDTNCKCDKCSVNKACEDKARYSSEIKARQERGRKEEEYGGKFSVYQCSLCEGWHLASVKG